MIAWVLTLTLISEEGPVDLPTATPMVDEATCEMALSRASLSPSFQSGTCTRTWVAEGTLLGPPSLEPGATVAPPAMFSTEPR